MCIILVVIEMRTFIEMFFTYSCIYIEYVFLIFSSIIIVKVVSSLIIVKRKRLSLK